MHASSTHISRQTGTLPPSHLSGPQSQSIAASFPGPLAQTHVPYPNLIQPRLLSPTSYVQRPTDLKRDKRPVERAGAADGAADTFICSISPPATLATLTTSIILFLHIYSLIVVCMRLRFRRRSTRQTRPPFVGQPLNKYHPVCPTLRTPTSSLHASPLGGKCSTCTEGG